MQCNENEKEKGNCKSRVAIVLLSCMSEDRESFSCHIYYFVIINCIISLGRFFLSLFRFHKKMREKKLKQPSKLFHFEFWFLFFHRRRLQYDRFSGKTHDYSSQCTIYNIGSEYIYIDMD